MRAWFARVRHALTRPSPRAAPRARRTWLRRTLIVLVCLPFVLVGLVLTALAVPFTRRPIVALALDLTNDSLDGMRIELDSADRLDLWGIELRGARLFDEKKREMVSVRKARVRIAPLSLITGTLSLREAEITGTRIHLYASDEPEEEEEEEPPSEPSSFQILAHRLNVNDLTFDMDLAGRALHAQLSELSAHGAYGPKTRAAIDKLKVSADLDGERALELHSESALWDEKKGGKVALAGELAGAALRVVYVVPAIQDDTRWPVRRAELHLTGLRNRGLARLGYGDVAQLRVPVDLHLKAATSGANDELLAGQLDLNAGNARLALTARASPSSYALELALKPVNLGQISGVLPELSAGLRLSAELRHDSAPMPLRVAWSEAWFDGRAVPSGNLSARLALPRIELEQLRLVGLEQALALRGSYDIQSGAASAALETHEFQLASLGGLLPEGTQGAVNGTLQASYAGRKLSGDAALSLRYFRMPDVRIDNASLGLDLSGTLREPRGQIELAAHQIESGETKIKRVAISAAAGLRNVDANLEVDGQDRLLSLVLTGKRADDGTLTVSGGGRGRIKDKHVGLTLKELRIEKERYAVEELSAFSGKERLYVSGSFAGGQVIDASLQIANLNLLPWSRLFLKDELTGQLDLSARVGGRIDAPVAEATLKVRDLHSSRTPRAPVVDLDTQVSLDMAKRRATLSLDTHSQDRRVALTLTAEAQLARTKALAQAFQRAKLKLDLKGHTDVPFLAQFAEAQLGPLDGKVSADVSISGGLDEAEMYAKFASELTPRDERRSLVPDRVDLDIVLKPKRLDVDLIVQDKFGRVIDLTSNAALPAGGPDALIAQGSKLMHTPVVLKLLVNERRLDQLQGSLGVLARSFGVALPVRAKAQIDVESTGQAITGKVAAHAHVWGEGLDDACEARAEGELSLNATLEGDKARAELSAQPSGGGKALITIESPLAVNSLLDGSAFAYGPASLRAHGEGLALETMPMLCMLPASHTNFELSSNNLGKAPLEATLALEVRDVETSDGTLAVSLSARTAPDAINAQGKLALAGAEKGRFSAQIPLAYQDSPLPKVPLDKPFQAGLDLPDFPLSGLTSFTDVVGRAGGRVRANVVAKGTLASPDPAGVIELKGASFSIASLAQPFSDVDARFELAPDKLVIRKLSARDRGGKLGMVGYARYNPTRGGEMQLYLSADKFPIRQQGSIIGELSTRAVLEGKVDARQQMQLELDLREGRIWLTGEGGRQVQELDEHPDIRFDTDQLALAQEPESEPETELTLTLLRIKSERDLWLMHEDFAVQVGVDMKLTSEENGFTMGGEATITRGDLNLLGKPFRIDRGAVRFTGDVPPDPELDLKAKHTTRQGKTLVVQIQGRASSPQIVFSGAANNAGEAAALLSGIGASGAESKAKTDAASFAAGLTAGLLAVSARRRFGDWVPMLAVESNAQGAPSGARAGFDASRLIPKFMQGFARGMFVEGVVGTRSDAQQRGVGVGVRVEVALPRDFMTSMGYGPGTVWSTDVYWSP